MRKRLVLPLFLLAGLSGLLAIPATTRQGIDFQVTERRIPLVVKAAGFLLRDYEYRRLAAELTHGLDSDERKADVLFRWTQERIRPAPPGWPVVDDHISHIIIRGYGQEDQRADVFTTLLTYSGVPAFWSVVRNPSQPGYWAPCYVKIGGRWTIWDVGTGTAFRDPGGKLVSVQELRTNPALLDLTAAQVPERARLYLLLADGRLDHFEIPDPLRAEKQMLIPRTLFQLRKTAAKLHG